MCYVVYISKWFSEDYAMFFCNFGRTHEEIVHFGRSPVSQKMPVSAQIYRNTLHSHFHSISVARLKCQTKPVEHTRNRRHVEDKKGSV